MTALTADATAARRGGHRRGALPTYLRAATDHWRMHALTPMSVLTTLLTPCATAFVMHTVMQSGSGPRHTTADLAIGAAGVGMLSSIIVMAVISFLSEKQWKTLNAALGSPAGLVPVVLGRLSGIALQTLVSLPASLLLLGLLWHLEDGFSFYRWAIGGIAIAFTTAAVIGSLAFIILRFPYSAGMTNGVSSIMMAVCALVVPPSALPTPLRIISLLMPQSHVMAWVRGGGTGQLLYGLGLGLAFATLVIVLVKHLEDVARQHASILEL